MAIRLNHIRMAAQGRPLTPEMLINYIFNMWPDVFPIGVVRQKWLVWASIFEPCVDCWANPGEPCIYLTDLKKEDPRIVKWPHQLRINWWLLLRTFQERGYIDEHLSMEDATLQTPGRGHQEADVERLRRRALDGAANR